MPPSDELPLTNPDCLAELPALAAACEQQVATALGVPLDGEIETLPILDHYVRQSRGGLESRPELLPLLQRTVGAYLGGVVARHFDGFWVVHSSDVHSWFVALREVYLAVNPVGLAHAALTWSLPDLGEAGPAAPLLLAREERDEVDRRLAALPEIRESDYYALSTRVETLEVVVAALRESALRRGTEETRYEEEDYREDVIRAAYG